ncbi:TIGR03619 family F420-dependent LLM class oxidoreductase [Mycobacterium sp. M1]|uniref:TIGR03619 family F420-dependent LLM class oxidoreductase n=1 Tax=Mycolicibacter acidiphilus TaxID=2835306 RepID=A0ABS5RJF9_9MYCO|nr:TIGR03619 family F420-dependent LLM class oxidoreductase [Mycolicibacter acidiphilus]MBS9534435.1 TIGR03619 family F420-dependent LLM class oxidoreductase [Mycolicibacter acidiphilus]
MRLGLSTPVVVQTPGMASSWEHGAGVDDVVQIAKAADELGFDYLTCSEHVAVPADQGADRGFVYWDPVATLSFLAAHTSRIRLATSIVVLGYHHPLEIVKAYGTLDRISGGRVVLGVGVGSIEDEFAMLGASWPDRGTRADDAILALRAAWAASRPSYAGEFYRFDDVICEPTALQPRLPIWVGGRTRRSLRRAVELCDGWMPFGLGGRQLAEMLAAVDIPEGFDIVLGPGPLDPLGDPDRVLRRLESLRTVGATVINCTVTATSAGHYCDQLGALRALADRLDGEGA